jgi:hypothetical protein
MNSINWAATFPALISIGSAISVAAGHPALGAVISSPDTAQNLTAALGGIFGLWSAFSHSIVKK